MKMSLLSVFACLAAGALAVSSAHAIDPAYARKLDRSGCTQLSEAQGCDINKTKAENARAGFGSAAASRPHAPPVADSPYAGRWVARSNEGATVASISIDSNEHVRVNGKAVNAWRSDGALVFTEGFITYKIQGDRRLKGEDTWRDSDAGTTGPIVAD